MLRRAFQHVGGFTPTCVGKIRFPRYDVGFSAVHPHVRGEDFVIPARKFLQRGSPPRAWGRSQHERWLIQLHRFTPTCVGKMPRFRWPTARAAVHPHVRGEDFKRRNAPGLMAGSPPRAWGRCALVIQPPRGIAVHPHVRGEDSALVARTAKNRRFTPTCVGKMENSMKETTLGHGSPPRAWGRFSSRRPSPSPRRFTPTCVGKIRSKGGGGHTAAVHPHVRGEDALPVVIRRHIAGSPPRAWGRSAVQHHAIIAQRFTPTCVGKMRLRIVRSLYTLRFTPTCVGKI